MTPITRLHHTKAASGQDLSARRTDEPVNKSGLPALPNEIYLEIVSHLPSMPIPILNRRSIEDESHSDRRQTLLALTQTCRSLRRVFLRYLWQRIEVYDGMQTSKGHLAVTYPRLLPGRPPTNLAHKQHAVELIQQLETVTIREPGFALYVSILNVSILEYSATTVLEELARCIALLPNLHTVQLSYTLNFHSRQFLDELFGKYNYPQVRTACLANSAAQFLRSCPNVCRLSAYMNEAWDGYTNEIFLPPSLEILGMIPFQRDAISKTVKQLPNLREVTLDPTLLLLGFDQLKPLSTLQHLHTIRLALNVRPPRRYFMRLPGHRILYKPSRDITETAQWVEWAKDILAKTLPQDIKRVILVDKHGREETYQISRYKRLRPLGYLSSSAVKADSGVWEESTLIRRHGAQPSALLSSQYLCGILTTVDFFVEGLLHIQPNNHHLASITSKQLKASFVPSPSKQLAFHHVTGGRSLDPLSFPNNERPSPRNALKLPRRTAGARYSFLLTKNRSKNSS
ncbi:hypothetical protein NLJ89_g708 [Agrocybe chaxingu]|uniref:F-box domain-containing protein n=1 Tax=Agrocybe chaxingu TaxID=84603 RepID=A0A9W8N1D9_9AGAR|nr:hypothetical protein NLJ89_g708 [Agrocybe chaxingu]